MGECGGGGEGEKRPCRMNLNESGGERSFLLALISIRDSSFVI
jgi:hypothetical protein